MVPVPKKDDSFRVCGDYESTVNQCDNVDQYPCLMKNSCARHYLVVKCSEKFIYHIPISKLS